MAERLPDLYPLPFRALAGRLDRELQRGEDVYSLARRDWWVADEHADVSMQHLAGRAATPLGPASGPHTQMAQNLVLAWLGGARFMELKTVQILDELEIPRPCIFVPNIGYNVEWSQELLVPQSAREYAAGWYLIHMLRSAQGPGLWKNGSDDTIFDLSLGYDLKGIQSEKVTGFIKSMQDASGLLDELRADIRDRYPRWADLEVPSRISSSTTLSTFHGCPADEIESIAAWTLEEHKLHTVIKLNPTLLGYDVVRGHLDAMGYQHVELDPEAFQKDLKWAQLMDFLPRLEAKAKALGLGLGVKFSNTLVCRSKDPPFADGEMYLSGPPLHVLALTLADQFRKATGGRFDISFSAGVDQMNFWKLAVAGLKPITTCSDILKGQGYAKLPRYLRNLEQEIKKAGATDIDGLRAALVPASDDPAGAWLSDLVEKVQSDSRYQLVENKRPPKKIGSHLALLDCITCDKCLKVCPNLANVTVTVETGEWNPGKVSWKDGKAEKSAGQPLKVDQKHQIGNVVDLCNLCGQCDPWCPEDGGPYLEKAHLFVTAEAWKDQAKTPGFFLEAGGIRWRRDDGEYAWQPAAPGAAQGSFTTPGGTLTLDGDDVVEATGEGEVDLRIARTLQLYLAGFLAENRELFVELEDVR